MHTHVYTSPLTRYPWFTGETRKTSRPPWTRINFDLRTILVVLWGKWWTQWVRTWVQGLHSSRQWWKLWIGSAVWCENWRCFNVTVLSLRLTVAHQFYSLPPLLSCVFCSCFNRNRKVAADASNVSGESYQNYIHLAMLVVMKSKLKKLELPSDFQWWLSVFWTLSWSSVVPHQWQDASLNYDYYFFVGVWNCELARRCLKTRFHSSCLKVQQVSGGRRGESQISSS